MKSALIIRDQETRQMAGRLEQDVQDGIRGITRKGGMRLTVTLHDISNCEESHALTSTATMIKV